MNRNRLQRGAFTVGDCIGGGITGAATAVAVRAVVSPNLDMALAMLLGMGMGMIVHLAIGLVLAPLLGMFHFMVPGSLIGMYGGMLFAMRDTMQQHRDSPGHAIVVGAVFGVIVIAGVRLYDRALRGGVSASPAAGGR